MNRGAIYVGLLLILAGLFFLLVNLACPAPGYGWSRLWPGILGLAAVGFYLPLLVWWEQRRALGGLVVPGTILLVNALLFLYNTLTSDWNAWAYLWTLEPVALALGLLLLWAIGPHHRSLLVAAATIGGIGLFLFAMFGLLFGSGLARLLAPIVLIALGLVFLIRSIGHMRA